MKIKRTKEQFLKKAIEIHGNMYDYSKINYNGCVQKIIIICKVHGEFIQSPANHLQGQGCKLCYFDSEKNDPKKFIEKCEKKHNNKYDYSKTIYTGIKNTIIIGCPIHGDFIQNAESHVRGRGCRRCTKYCGKTTQQFIIESKLKHGEKYDYSHVEYKNSRIKVKIICKKHGVFEQIAGVHRAGGNCPECSNCKRHDNESFIKKSRLIHGNKYDYSLIEYINTSTKIKIKCPIHGIFKQKPNTHLNGHGCSKCADERGVIVRSLSQDEYISRVKKKYGDLYKYHKVKYVNQYQKIKVFCNIHKKFFMTIPTNHLRGSGCPKCNSSKGEIIIREFLKKNNVKFEEQKKFDGCKYKKLLLFDFYLKEYNLIIEFNGLQHYKSIPFFNKTIPFEIQKEKDLIKKKFAEENSIKFLEIPVWQKNNIELILLKELKLEN